MFALGIFLVTSIAVAAAVQWLGVAYYLKRFRHYEGAVVADEHLPKAAVILSLRGAAPFLQECLTRLATQNYPDFSIHLVIDHPSDPATMLVEDWRRANPGRTIAVEFLRDPSKRAYLKTSAVLQAVRTLDDDVEAVALADADTLAHPDWLRELVAPLVNKEIGLVTGNRWYDPTSRSLGGLCRFFYNSFCVAPMYFMGATWGGSMSMKREVFNSNFFCDKMTDTPCEDAAMQAAARHAGKRLEVRPDLMMFNIEPCSFREAFDFMKRQLLWTRLYHPSWYVLLAGTWILHLLLVATPLLGIYQVWIGSKWLGAIMLCVSAVPSMVSLVLTERQHRTIAESILRHQGTRIPDIDSAARLRLSLALPLAFVMMCYAMLAAELCSSVRWSGITYQIVDGKRLRMIEYVPLNEVVSRQAA